MLSDVSEGELCVSNGGIGERTRGGGVSDRRGVFILRADGGGGRFDWDRSSLFFFLSFGHRGGKKKKGVRRP